MQMETLYVPIALCTTGFVPSTASVQAHLACPSNRPATRFVIERSSVQSRSDAQRSQQGLWCKCCDVCSRIPRCFDIFLCAVCQMLTIDSPTHRDRRALVRPSSHAVRAVAALVSLSFSLVACNDTIAPLPQEGAPAALEFSIGGYGGGGSRVTLVGDTVVMWRLSPAWTPGTPIDTVRVVPDSAAWRAFWLATQQAGTDQWQGRYNANGIADGLGWDLRLVAGGRQIVSYGSNAYPDRSGKKHEGDVTDDFRVFVAALSDLAGRRVWF